MNEKEKDLSGLSRVAEITAVAAAMVLVVLLALSLVGRLHPRKTVIHLRTPDITHVYDETAVPVSQPELVGGTLLPGHVLQVKAQLRYTKVGAYVNKPEFAIIDDTGAEVTGLYEIIGEFGTLEITPIQLTVSTESAVKTYDGQPLTADQWQHLEGQLLEGHRVEMTVTGSLTQTGLVENRGTARVTDAQGIDVTELYEIEYSFGTLEVKGLPLYISTGSATKVYDSQPLENTQWTLTEGQLEEGATLELWDWTQHFTVGTVANIMKFRVVREDGTDITDGYRFELQPGNLQIQPRTLSIRTGNARKVYDGTPLVCDSYTITSGGLCPGDELEMTFVSITDVGYCPNYPIQYAIYRTVDGQRMDVTVCYQLRIEYGQLKITAE